MTVRTLLVRQCQSSSEPLAATTGEGGLGTEVGARPRSGRAVMRRTGTGRRGRGPGRGAAAEWPELPRYVHPETEHYVGQFRPEVTVRAVVRYE